MFKTCELWTVILWYELNPWVRCTFGNVYLQSQYEQNGKGTVKTSFWTSSTYWTLWWRGPMPTMFLRYWKKNSTISCSHWPFVEHVWHHDIREAVKYYFVDYLRQGRGGYPTNPYHFLRLKIVSANGGWSTPLIRNLLLTMAIFAILRWWQTCSAKCPLQVTMTRSRMRKIMMRRMTMVCTMIIMMMCR